MSLEFEKDFDDEVYEDSFYSDDEEELEEDSENEGDDTKTNVVKNDDDEDEDLEEDDAIPSLRVEMSFVCDDCDYRWDDTIIQKNNQYNEAEEITDSVCPMCGSMNVAQI